MTSKNCFSKRLVRDLKERGVWLISSIILFLLIYPVQILMSLDAIASYMKGEEEFHSRITEQFSSLISFGNGIMYVVIVIMAFLLAMSGFWYVYSGVKTDFYHSLPIKREKLFLERYVTGILIFVVPYFISLILGYGAGIMKGAGTSGILSLCAKGFVTNVVLFLLFYNLAVLGVLLTGNLFTGVLAYGAFLIYGILLDSATKLTKLNFFTTCIDYTRKGALFDGSFSILSPLYAMNEILSGNKVAMKNVGIVFIVSLIIVVICILVYKIRPTESYHKAIAFRKLQPVIKVAVVLPLSAMVGILASEIVGRDFIWYVGGILVSALLLSAAIEFLYHLDIKECIRPKISTGVILVVLAGMIVVLKLDFIGFDTYLPKESKLKTMSIYIDELNGYYEYPGEYAISSGNSGSFLDLAKIEEFDDVYQLAKKGVELQKERDDVGSYTTESGMLSFSVRYELKNGKVVYRGYSVEKNEENLKLVAKIYDNWEFKQKSLPVEYVDENKITSLEVADIQSCYDSGLSKEEVNNLFKTCKNEWESATYEQLKDSKVLGFLHFYLELKKDEASQYYYGPRYVSVPIYSSFQQTRALLEQNNCHITTLEDYDEVQSIEIDQYDEENGDIENTVKIKDKNQIKEILDSVHITDNTAIFDGHDLDYSINIWIHWKNGMDSNTDGSYSCYFRTGEVPEFVTKALEE